MLNLRTILRSIGGCIALATVSVAVSAPAGCSTGRVRDAEAVRVGAVLDQLHEAASRADESAYFALFDASGVFIGTDAGERWPVGEFRAYAHARFARGEGWTYTPTSRHVDLSSDGRTAWFDEMLDSAKYGVCRGTGVLTRRGGHWKIVQYHLTVPIPNDLLPEVAQRIRDAQENGR